MRILKEAVNRSYFLVSESAKKEINKLYDQATDEADGPLNKEDVLEALRIAYEQDVTWDLLFQEEIVHEIFEQRLEDRETLISGVIF